MSTPEHYLEEAKQAIQENCIAEPSKTDRALIREIVYCLEDILNVIKYGDNPNDIIRIENRLNIIRKEVE